VDTEDLQAQIAAAEADTAEALKELRRAGAQVDNMYLLSEKLDAFIDFALGEDNEVGRLHFQLAFQQRLAGNLRELKAQVARARLTQGLNGGGMKHQ